MKSLGSLLLALYALAALSMGLVLADWMDGRNASRERLAMCRPEQTRSRTQLTHPGLKWPWRR